MSQQQQQRPQRDPIKYGDVFPVHGELADKPVAPRDAAMMQAAETSILGKVPAGGVAATMQSAAAVNEMVGAVGHGVASREAAEQGVTVTDQYVPARVVTAAVGGQVVGQYVQPVKGGAGDQGACGGKGGGNAGEGGGGGQKNQ